MKKQDTVPAPIMRTLGRRIGSIYATQPRAGLWNQAHDYAFLFYELTENRGSAFLSFRCRTPASSQRVFDIGEMLCLHTLQVCNVVIAGESVLTNLDKEISACLQLRVVGTLPVQRVESVEADRLLRWVLS